MFALLARVAKFAIVRVALLQITNANIIEIQRKQTQKTNRDRDYINKKSLGKKKLEARETAKATKKQAILNKKAAKIQERLDRKIAKKTTKALAIQDKTTIKLSKKTTKTFATASKKWATAFDDDIFTYTSTISSVHKAPSRKRAPPKKKTQSPSMSRIAETPGSEQLSTPPSPSSTGSPSKRLPIRKTTAKREENPTITSVTSDLQISKSTRIIFNIYKNQMTTNTYTLSVCPDEESSRLDSAV